MGDKTEDNGSGNSVVDLLKKIFFVDLLKGLKVTMGYNASPVIAEKYPDEEKWVPYRRFRGIHRLHRNEEGKELCVACELCSKICPTDCITVIPMEDDTGRGTADRVSRVWKVDLVRCLFCGYCEDACPTTAIRLGREYEIATFDLESAVLHKEDLLEPQPVPESFPGGVVARARFLKEREKKKISVEADLGKFKKRTL